MCSIAGKNVGQNTGQKNRYGFSRRKTVCPGRAGQERRGEVFTVGHLG